MNKEVNFEIAKLLKERGFDEPCPNLYYQPERCKKPTIAQVVMWLYEKHGIWIVVDEYNNDEEGRWFYNWKSLKTQSEGMDSGFTSPTEAYESAIKYTLENLI